MLFPILLFILGFVLLIVGANFLIKSAALLGKKYNISSIVIGMVVVGFGTSLPELIISVMAVIKGSADISISNAIGSNIANIMIVLGILALITTVSAVRHTIRIKIPFVIFTSLVVFIVSNERIITGSDVNVISRWDGIIFLLIFAYALYYSLFKHKEKPDNEDDDDSAAKIKGRVIAIMLIFGLGGVIIGGNWVVENAIEIARYFGMSEAFIGVSILAVGSSLPEIITSVVAALKKESGIAIGNIIGSNVFNTFLILGIASIIHPLNVSGEQQFNMLVNIFASVLFLLFVIGGKKGSVSKTQGIILLIMYSAFIYVSFQYSSELNAIFG